MEYGKNNESQTTITKTLHHVHTQYSVRDAVESPKALVERAVELGYEAIIFTDHGNLHATNQALAAGFRVDKETKKAVPVIKVILGVEAYVLPDKAHVDTPIKYHLCLIAKNLKGFQAISNAVTDSQLYRDSRGFPRMTYEILQRHFGPGSDGHGNVIATSACMQGEIAMILLAKSEAENKIARLEEKREKVLAKLPFTEEELMEARNVRDSEDGYLKELVEEHKRLSFLAKKPYAKRKRDIELRKKRGEDASAEEAALTQEIAESEAAAERLPNLKDEIAESKQRLKEANARLNEILKAYAPCERIERDIEEARLELDSIDESTLYDTAAAKAVFYESIFGEGNYFIELQRHGIAAEEVVFPLLWQIARETGIKVVGANDVHYCRKEDARRRDIIAALRFNDPIEEMQKVGHDELYIKSVDEMNALFGSSEPMANAGLIADMCEQIAFPKGFHMPQFIPPDGMTAIQYLEKLARDGIPDRYPNWDEKLEQRLRHELDVIEKSGYASYLCVVQDFLECGRELGRKKYDENALVIGPGRGSAVGSLVCYLAGITDVDPIKYELIFERFLNLERVSMPDIDSDFMPDIRGDVVQYVRDKYGDDAVCGIVTMSKMMARAVIRNVGRVTGVPLSLCDKVAKLIPQKPGMTLQAAIDGDTTLTALSKGVAVEGYTASEAAQVCQLLKDAKSVEGTIIGTGVHAAGVIIADRPVRDYIPLLWNEKKQVWVAQYDMNECEKNAGLLKMDFLGLINLAIITQTIMSIKQLYGKSVDLRKIDMNDQNVLEMFRRGQTNCVFQFESSGMKEMLRQFRPTSFEDLILLVAAYRPGPMQYIPDIIDVKNGKKKPTYIVKGMETILGKTYGKPIYQEQVMQIFNKFAGFTLGEADIIRRAMGKKKLEELLPHKPKFISGLKKAGAKESDAEELWNQLLDFAQYAFNKSHAAAYATISMYTAWLKHYYPAEYMAAVLSLTNSKKLPMYIQECKSLGVKVSPPDINRSGENFTPVPGKEILFGLGSIKNVASAAADIIKVREEHGPFSLRSFASLMYANLRSNVIESLVLAGAFDNLQPHRKALLDFIPALLAEYKAYTKLMQEIAEIKRQIDESTTEVKPATLQALARREENAAVRLQNFRTMMCNTIVQDFSPTERLEKEHEYLRYYASGHPLDSYRRVMESERTMTIGEIEEGGNARLCGRIKAVQKLKTKADNADMAKAVLEDLTGEIEVIMFPKAYAKYGRYLVEGAVVKASGLVKIELDEGDGDEDSGEMSVLNAELVINELKPLKAESGNVVIGVPDVVIWNNVVLPAIEKLPRGGFEIRLRLASNEMRMTTVSVADFDELQKTLKRIGIENVARIA